VIKEELLHLTALLEMNILFRSATTLEMKFEWQWFKKESDKLIRNSYSEKSLNKPRTRSNNNNSVISQVRTLTIILLSLVHNYCAIYQCCSCLCSCSSKETMNHVQIKWKAVAFVLFLIVIIVIIIYYLYGGMPVCYVCIEQFGLCHSSF